MLPVANEAIDLNAAPQISYFGLECRQIFHIKLLRLGLLKKIFFENERCVPDILLLFEKIVALSDLHEGAKFIDNTHFFQMDRNLMSQIKKPSLYNETSFHINIGDPDGSTKRPDSKRSEQCRSCG